MTDPSGLALPAIRAFPMFATLSPAEQQGLAAVSHTLRLADGSRLFAEGDASDDLYMVVGGQLRLSCSGKGGVQVVVGTVSAGGLLGEMAVLDPAPRSATATAMGDAWLVRLPAQAFSRLVSDGHPAARALLRQLRLDMAARFRTLDDRLDAVFTVESPDPQRPGLATRLRRALPTWLAGR